MKTRHCILFVAVSLIALIISSADVIVHSSSAVGIQSSTSIAGNSTGAILIAGYADQRGFPAPTDPDQITLSVSGVARSANGGTTWAEVPVGPGGSGRLPTVTNGSVYGESDVKYDPTRDVFFYCSIYVRPSDALQGVCLHVSNSGPNAGTAWTGPIEVAPTFVATHAGDKPFIDVNVLTGRILLSWTDFDNAAVPRIKTVFSDDGGTTWSAAVTVATGSASVSLQSSVPRFLPAATNATSTGYVVWRINNLATRNIGASRSTDGGASWSVGVNLDAISFPVEDQILGVDRINTSPSLAIDYASGTVFTVYQRNSATGEGDIALRSFVGVPATGTAVLLNSNPGSDRAQFYPSVAVDQSSHRIHVSWLDQDTQATGDLTEAMYTYSTDLGVTWAPPTPLLDRPFHAGYGNDTGQPNLGDYNQMVAINGALHALFAATAVAPRFDEGQPTSQTLMSPDVYYRKRLDSQQVCPLRLGSYTLGEASSCSVNGLLDPGEDADLSISLENYVSNAWASTITSISATLSTTTPQVSIPIASSSYPNIAPLALAANNALFRLHLTPSFAVGTYIDLLLTVTTTQGTTQLPLRVATGTPGTPVVLINEDFESVVVPALPSGWSAVNGTGTSTPWVTSIAFSPMTGKFAFHTETSTNSKFMRLFSPVVAVPTPAGASYVTLDFDIAYRLEDDPTKALQAYDGVTLRITDQTGGGSILRSVLAEAFAESIKTGSANHFPKHLPRSNDSNYLSAMSVWSGNSNGVKHVSMKFPGLGMTGRSVQLRFEYTQDASGDCTTAGYSTPCGIGIDNVKFNFVPLIDGICSGLRITNIARSNSDVVVSFQAAQGSTYRLERKLDVTDATWQSIAGVSDLIASNNGTAQITDPGAVILGKAFYRVRLLSLPSNAPAPIDDPDPVPLHRGKGFYRVRAAH